MLPAPREPLWLRPGEQNLHILDAGFHPSGRPAASALCSPLPDRPCGSVSGSKIFTQLPTPKRSFAGKPVGPFAPRSPLTLVASSRGAKSSHSRRRFSPVRPPGGLRFLLPSPREPLWLRPGEQNLHIPDAGFHPSGRPAAFAFCSPLPAKPCASVPGSKIFTFPTPVFTLPAARRPPLFAPPSPLGLVAPSRGAKSSYSRQRFSPSRPPDGFRFLLPPSPLSLVPPFRGAKSSHNFRPLSAVPPANQRPQKEEAAAPPGAAASLAFSKLPYLPVFTVFSSSGFRPALQGLQRMRPADPDTGPYCCHPR